MATYSVLEEGWPICEIVLLFICKTFIQLPNFQTNSKQPTLWDSRLLRSINSSGCSGWLALNTKRRRWVFSSIIMIKLDLRAIDLGIEERQYKW